MNRAHGKMTSYSTGRVDNLVHSNGEVVSCVCITQNHTNNAFYKDGAPHKAKEPLGPEYRS